MSKLTPRMRRESFDIFLQEFRETAHDAIDSGKTENNSLLEVFLISLCHMKFAHEDHDDECPIKHTLSDLEGQLKYCLEDFLPRLNLLKKTGKKKRKKKTALKVVEENSELN